MAKVHVLLKVHAMVENIVSHMALSTLLFIATAYDCELLSL